MKKLTSLKAKGIELSKKELKTVKGGLFGICIVTITGVLDGIPHNTEWHWFSCK